MKIKSLLFKRDIFLVLCIFIITVPAFLSLLNNSYFTMHDDQHIARLFLLDQAIQQGSLYPRWVDVLGFGFGYPLFNFYPPLIYYVGELFHLLGFSYIWSIKLIIVTGFVIGAVGMYFFAHKFMSRYASLVTSTLFTYFGYRAVTVYVRGAFAEFFAMSILPFVFLSLYNLYKNSTRKSSIYFGICLALLIVTHPLIATPATLFLGLFSTFYFALTDKKRSFVLHTGLGGIIGFGLSAFFWLPSLIERRYTLIDTVLLRELADYVLHFVYPFQFWYSPWGFGGSIAGPADGVSFALGKIYIGLTTVALVLLIVSFIKRKGASLRMSNSLLVTSYLLLLFFSLLMSTPYSKFIWDSIPYLHYLQFPWRFLTFTTIFIALIGGFAVELLSNIIAHILSFWRSPESISTKHVNKVILTLLSTSIIVGVILIQQKYFRPQQYIQTSDAQRTSYEEIAWSISRSSFEFAPRGVQTTKSKLGTTVIDITKDQIPQSLYEVVAGEANAELMKNNFDEKVFIVRANEPTLFRLNTFNFPGWNGKINNTTVSISDTNPYHLITIQVPQGEHEIKFEFKDTPIRITANIISLISLLGLLGYLLRQSLNSNK